MNAGEVVQSRYRLEETLGKGGMATVWRAHDLRLERPVALKCLMAPLSEDPTFLVRFFSEAQQVAKLSHPNVIRVLDFGEGGECPYLVMEFVPGGSLDALTGAPMEAERALALIAGAAHGVGAAHAAGLVHRDLKPGNIMIGDGGVAKVGDFGIAVTQAQERLTATGTAIGSPHYVSPEQASGRPIGPAADVYSLGVVLYELLTGTRPFEADNAMALAISHVEEAPQPPSVHNPELLPELDAIVMKCLAKDPGDRFQNGDDLASALERHVVDPHAASFAPATAIAAAPVTSLRDEVPDERHERRFGGRTLSVSLMAAVFLGLLAFGVMALVGPEEGPKPEKAAAAVPEQEGSVNAQESPSPARSEEQEGDHYEGEEGAVVAAPSPSATPTEDPEEDESEAEPAAENDEGNDGSGGGGSGTGGESEPEPTTEPSTEPTSEPTAEPQPEPTSSP